MRSAVDRQVVTAAVFRDDTALMVITLGLCQVAPDPFVASVLLVAHLLVCVVWVSPRCPERRHNGGEQEQY